MKIFFSLFLMLYTAFIFPQNLKVTGTVKDASSGEILPMCNISISSDNTKGVSSDFDGKYELQLAPGSYELLVSYIGYKTEKIPVTVTDKDIRLDIQLYSTGVLLQEVSVYSSKEEEEQTVSSLSLQSQEMKEIASVFPDVFRSIQALPGIAANNEFSGKFNVRGGSYDENLVLVNGTQVYEPFHLKEAENASVGIFNLDLMKKVNLMTGGFSAQYGDRLSSVLNMEYREGSKDKYMGAATLSLTNLDGYAEGPISDNATYILGIRKSYLEYILSIVDVKENIKPSFYDVQGVLTYNLSSLDKLQLKFVHAGDNFTLGPTTETDPTVVFNAMVDGQVTPVTQNDTEFDDESAEYYSSLLDFKGTFFLSQDAFITPSISYYHQYDMEHSDNSEDFSQDINGVRDYFFKSTWQRNYDYSLKIKTWEAKTALDAKVSAFYDIKAGVSYLDINYDQDRVDIQSIYTQKNWITFPDTTTTIEDLGSEEHITAGSYKLAGFIENVFQLNDNFILNAGARVDYFDINKDLTFSPRISASYILPAEITLRAAWGHYYQSPIYRQLAYSAASDTNTKSQKAEHFILGLEKSFLFNGNLQNKLTFKAEGYYKKYSRLINAERTENGDILYSRKNDSKGYATGLDLYLSLKLNSYYGWISYGLLFSKEDVSTDTLGYIPRFTDQRHTLSIVNDFDLGKQWNLNLRFTYGSGFAFTPKYALYDEASQRYKFYSDPANITHLPEYKRVDLRVSKSFYMFGMVTTAFLDVNNLLNFKNIDFYQYRLNEDGSLRVQEVELWPIIPSVGITVNL